MDSLVFNIRLNPDQESSKSTPDMIKQEWSWLQILAGPEGVGRPCARMYTSEGLATNLPKWLCSRLVCFPSSSTVKILCLSQSSPANSTFDIEYLFGFCFLSQLHRLSQAEDKITFMQLIKGLELGEYASIKKNYVKLIWGNLSIFVKVYFIYFIIKKLYK